MSWNRIKCAMLGHRYEISDVAAEANCVRCDHKRSAIKWQRETQYTDQSPRERVLSWGISIPAMQLVPRRGANINQPPAYTRPAPQSAPPPRKEVMRIKVEIDGLDEAKAEIERLHARYSEVIALQERIAKGE